MSHRFCGLVVRVFKAPSASSSCRFWIFDSCSLSNDLRVDAGLATPSGLVVSDFSRCQSRYLSLENHAQKAIGLKVNSKASVPERLLGDPWSARKILGQIREDTWTQALLGNMRSYLDVNTLPAALAHNAKLRGVLARARPSKAPRPNAKLHRSVLPSSSPDFFLSSRLAISRSFFLILKLKDRGSEFEVKCQKCTIYLLVDCRLRFCKFKTFLFFASGFCESPEKSHEYLPKRRPTADGVQKEAQRPSRL